MKLFICYRTVMGTTVGTPHGVPDGGWDAGADGSIQTVGLLCRVILFKKNPTCKRHKWT